MPNEIGMARRMAIVTAESAAERGATEAIAEARAILPANANKALFWEKLAELATAEKKKALLKTPHRP